MYVMNEGFCDITTQRAARRQMLAVSCEQMYLDERTHLEEMGMDAGNAVEDKLPFKIVLMNPDSGAPQPHAHIMARGYGGGEVGAFALTNNPPRTIADLVSHSGGKHKGLKNVPIEWQRLIIKWAAKRSYLDEFRTNWQYLQHQCYINDYIARHKEL